MTTYHFISGLPRSGSTLLAAILRQNPRFHAGMTSPIGGLYSNIVSQVSAGSELAPMVNREQRRNILRGLFHSYYKEIENDKAVIFDTNRSWTAKLPSLVELFPDCRVLCCVRDIGWVMDSLERQYRANTFENTRLFNSPAERSSVYTRLDALARADRLVGHANSALREACYGEQAARLLLIDYDFLTRRPSEVVGLIYDFLGETYYSHDFENVVYDAEEFDEVLGVRGLHRIRRKVEPQRRASILPPDLFNKYQKQNFWNQLQGSSANIIAATGYDKV